jgi:hypothetical protein
MTRRLRRAIAVAAVWTVACLSASAQTAGSAVADPGAPGPEHRTLDAMAGSWDVTVTFPAGPGKQMSGKSTCQA